jgi:hypothetical protein
MATFEIFEKNVRKSDGIINNLILWWKGEMMLCPNRRYNVP